MTVHLNNEETWCLALRVAMRRLAAPDWWLEWEDYPMLDETSHRLLIEQVNKVYQMVDGWSHDADRGLNIDSADLLERTA